MDVHYSVKRPYSHSSGQALKKTKSFKENVKLLKTGISRAVESSWRVGGGLIISGINISIICYARILYLSIVFYVLSAKYSLFFFCII